MLIGPGRLGGGATTVDFFFHEYPNDGRRYISHGIKVDGTLVAGSWAEYDYDTYGIEGMRSRNQEDAQHTVRIWQKMRANGKQPIFPLPKPMTKESEISSATFAEIQTADGNF